MGQSAWAPWLVFVAELGNVGCGSQGNTDFTTYHIGAGAAEKGCFCLSVTTLSPRLGPQEVGPGREEALRAVGTTLAPSLLTKIYSTPTEKLAQNQLSSSAAALMP